VVSKLTLFKFGKFVVDHASYRQGCGSSIEAKDGMDTYRVVVRERGEASHVRLGHDVGEEFPKPGEVRVHGHL